MSKFKAVLIINKWVGLNSKNIPNPAMRKK